MNLKHIKMHLPLEKMGKKEQLVNIGEDILFPRLILRNKKISRKYKMTKYLLLIFTTFLAACSCDNDSCRFGETFFKGEAKEDGENLKPWEKPTETVSGIKKKEEIRLQKNFLTLDTQSLSTREMILKKKREEEKKALERKTK